MLRLRVASAAVLVPLLLGVLLAGQPWLTAAVAVAAVIAARETFRLLDGAGIPGQPVLGALIALLVVGEAWLLPGEPGAAPAAAAIGVVAAGIWSFRRLDPRQGFRTWLGTAFGGLYVALIAFVVRIAEAPLVLPTSAPLAASLDGGRAWLLILVGTVWAYDTGAYVAGRAFGRGRFLAHISPSKTWSGLAGGTAAGTAACAALLIATGQVPLMALLLGPLIGLAAQAGDIAESMLKRAAGAKDSGSLIPGHGGMLDRIDSFLFAAPVTYGFLVLSGLIA